MGLRVTLRHYYDFGSDRAIVGDDLVNPEAWDRLRTETTGPFAIPATRDEFVRAADELTDIANRARAIDAWLEERGAQVVGSYGVGGAMLEWWLHKLHPTRELILGDYADASVRRLTEVFPEVRIVQHDLRKDGPLPAEWHVFHRIDTELDDSQWGAVFERFARDHVLVVATQVLDAKHVLLELTHRATSIRSGRSRAGFMRTRAAFEALWNGTHEAERLRMHDLDAWGLAPRLRHESPPGS